MCLKNLLHSRRSSVSFLYLVTVLSIVFSGGHTALAQQTTAAGKGAQANNSYKIDNIEAINKSNGNVSLRIPLVSLPNSHNEVTGSIGLFYNSKLIEVRPEIVSTKGTVSVWQDPNAPRVYTRQKLAQSEDGGWRYGFQYELRLRDRLTYYSTDMLRRQRSSQLIDLLELVALSLNG